MFVSVKSCLKAYVRTYWIHMFKKRKLSLALLQAVKPSKMTMNCQVKKRQCICSWIHTNDAYARILCTRIAIPYLHFCQTRITLHLFLSCKVWWGQNYIFTPRWLNVQCPGQNQQEAISWKETVFHSRKDIQSLRKAGVLISCAWEALGWGGYVLMCRFAPHVF